MHSYHELEVWKEAMKLAKEVYEITRSFPQDEFDGLTSQLRRSSKSVLLTIAEGFGRYTYADKANKYVIARGECTETDAALLIASELGFVPSERVLGARESASRTGRMLSCLIAANRK